MHVVRCAAAVEWAERSGSGAGRIYTIVVEGQDAAGNTDRQSVTVRVPLSQ